MRFCSIEGVEPSVKCLKGIRITIMLYQPTMMCYSSCHILFWNTRYNTPRTFCLPATQSYFTINVLHQNSPSTINTAYKPLTATSRTNTLPFLIPIRKLVLYRGQHHLLLFAYSSSPFGLVSTHCFLYTCFIVTSTRLISERTLAGVSRLA